MMNTILRKKKKAEGRTLNAECRTSAVLSSLFSVLSSEFITLGLFLLVSIAAGKVDLDKAVNQAVLTRLNEPAKKLLAANGFVAIPSHDVQFYDIYKRLAKSNAPMLVTTDCALHSFHILFDYTLRELEVKYFADDVKSLTGALLEYELRALGDAKNPLAVEALTDNVAYLAVAAALLDSTFKITEIAEGIPLPQSTPVGAESLPRFSVEKLVQEELALIEAHVGSTGSPLMGYDEDYSQYVPRGHYTRSELLKRYFKAMMWYGRIGFALKPGNRPEDIAHGRELTYRALLLCQALQEAKVGNDPAITLWQKIYDVTTFLVGRSDDLNVHDYLILVAEVFGDKNILPDRPNDAQLDQFIARAMALQAPRIVSQVVPDTLKPERVTKGFRFMGQRYIPDSYMFQELVYTKVGTQQDPRLMPKGLDVMAALGSKRALEILKTLYHEDRYLNYESQMRKLREEFAKLTPKEWNQNVYFGWLYALKLQNEPLAKNKLLPEFCFVPAYADKCLVTACGSWAQLRHDTILYAKQSYTMLTTAMPGPRTEKPKPIVYVEPKPAVFAQIAALSGQMIEKLDQAGVLSTAMKARLDQLRSLAAMIGGIAEKEVTGQKPGDDEIAQVARVGEAMEDFAESPGEGPTSEADRSIETVADVHTDPNAGLALEEAVGKPLELCALAPFEGKWYLASGAMFSYYEFTRPMADRMSDEQWQALSPRPPMPEWSSSFVTE